MPRTTYGLTARGLLAAGIAAATLLTVSPTAAADAAPTRTPAVSASAIDPEAQKWAVADKFGLGDDASLLLKSDRDFVIAIWTHLKDKPAHREVRIAAEQAFTLGDAACNQFIVTDVFAAFERDLDRQKREAEAKRLSDAARAAAASTVDIIATKTMLDATDARFAELIRDAVKDQLDKYGDKKWPKVVAAAEAARRGSIDQQREFIAAGLAAAAKQDIDDGITKDTEQDALQKAEARARAAKKSAAERIGMPVTEELLKLPYRDFVITVANYAADGTQVQIAAFAAFRSLNPTDWEAFVNTGIHQAKDRDQKIIDDAKAAEERRLVEELLARAEKAGRFNLPQAARKALAGTRIEIAEFLYTGQYAVTPDRPDSLHGSVGFGRATGINGRCLDIHNALTADGSRVQVVDCNGNHAQDVTTPGDGTLRLLGKCIDSGGAPTGDPGDRLVHLWSCNSTPAQAWHHRTDGSIYQPATGRCLDTAGSHNGASLYIHACNGGAYQQWALAAPGAARFGKVTGVAGKCVAVLNGSNGDRTPVTLHDCVTGHAQDVTLPGDNTLRLVGKCIDSSGPLVGGPGQRQVYLWTCNGSPAQKWTQSPDGTLYNEWTKYCLDVPNSNNGSQLYVHPCNAGTNQRWKLPQAR